MNLKFHYLVILLVFLAVSESGAQSPEKQMGSLAFKKHILSTVFVSEGVAVADVNRDGQPDVLAGNYWFQAPGWNRSLIHADTLLPIKGYSTTFANFSMDVNRDGWTDLIRFDQPGGVCVWYENPKNKTGLWQKHMILKTAGMENPAFVDVNKDGRMDLICNNTSAKQVIWLESPRSGTDTVWRPHVISRDSVRATHMYTHGLGFGDLNQDGREDVIIKSGWWESPVNVNHEDWIFHAADFGQDCANIFVLDADQDGDQDVISSSAHDYGIWWHEQQKDERGFVSWTTHVISNLFSEAHALALEDVNADGHPDLITGKRYFAHNGGDPGGYEPAVLYWFEYLPGKTPQWIPHLIDNNSGVGINFVVKDMNNDGLADIIISNKKGVFVFEKSRK